MKDQDRIYLSQCNKCQGTLKLLLLSCDTCFQHVSDCTIMHICRENLQAAKVGLQTLKGHIQNEQRFCVILLLLFLRAASPAMSNSSTIDILMSLQALQLMVENIVFHQTVS